MDLRVRLAALSALAVFTWGLGCTANQGVPQPTPGTSATAAIVGTIVAVPAQTPVPDLTPPPSPSGVRRLSANFASREELRAAFAAAGILNAAKWAEIIEEARPYQGQDGNLVIVRANLREAGATAEEVEAIARLLVP